MQMWAIWKVTWHLFIGALPFKLVNDAATFVGPIFLNLLLGVVSAGQSSTLGYSYAAVMFVGPGHRHPVRQPALPARHARRYLLIASTACYCMHACKIPH